MSKLPAKSLRAYTDLLGQVKSRIRQAQTWAVLSANAEMIHLYWDIGHMVHRRQQEKGWGQSVIPRLARDIRREFPESKGFSERNIGYMIRFAKEYPILQQPVAKLLPSAASLILQQSAAKLPSSSRKPILHQPGAKLASASKSPILQQSAAKLAKDTDVSTQIQSVFQLPWFHNVILMERVKDLDTRVWYMRETIKNGWSRDVLSMMIASHAHRRQGKAITNFAEHFSPEQSDLAIQTLKDPYLFDFLTLEEPFREHELETQLLQQLQKFLIELGQGFAFVGRQILIKVGEKEFRIDLLFYHLYLRSFVLIDLKTDEFKAEYAGKMNFYLNLIDEQFRHASDNPSIGLILCQERDRLVAEYALRGMQKPIGVSEYELTRALPKEYRTVLPSIALIEAELSERTKPSKASKPAARKLALKKKGKR